MDIAALVIWEGAGEGLGAAAVPLRVVVIAHVLIAALIWLKPQPQRKQLRETCLLVNLRATAVQKTKPSQIPFRKKGKALALRNSSWCCAWPALLCSTFPSAGGGHPTQQSACPSCAFISCAQQTCSRHNPKPALCFGLAFFLFLCLLPLNVVSGAR